jgi:hypothetical protein
MATVDHKELKPAIGGDMAWKKALFLGGAVLLLAACSDATAPKSLVRDGSTPAAKLVVPVEGPALNTLDSLDPAQLLDEASSCRSGYYVRSGEKDVCLEVPEIP